MVNFQLLVCANPNDFGLSLVFYFAPSIAK